LAGIGIPNAPKAVKDIKINSVRPPVCKPNFGKARKENLLQKLLKN
jgi:hypothetical protein